MAAKTTENKTNVVIEINNTDFKFSVGVTDFNTLQNEMLPNDKVAPSENFLMATVDSNQKDDLIALFDQGYGVELASIVGNEFKPALAAKVKK